MGCATSVYVGRDGEDIELTKKGAKGKDDRRLTPDAAVKDNKGKTAQRETVSTVPFGHIGYTLSLPEAMGPLLEFPIGWWFHAGWGSGYNKDGLSEQITMMMTLGRGGESVIGGGTILYGIGRISPGSTSPPFVSNSIEGIGVFPPPTSASWEVSAVTDTKSDYMTCKLQSGVLGLPGATYSLDMVDTTEGVTVSLMLEDTYGMVLEGTGGGFRTGKSGGSLEFAMPSLSIKSGSTVTIENETTTLTAGRLWLDRQTLSKGPPKGRALYCGNWIPIRMNDGTHYNLVFLWPTKKDQWIVGSQLNPPVEPLHTIGLEYPSLEGWDGRTPIQGINVLDSTEFDLNILDTSDPSKSPHWTSKKTGQTYCNAWRMQIKGKNYTMQVLAPDSEIACGTPAFFEGAARITDDNGIEVGRAFVEQMGYTQ
jgi:hypothetical protein